MDKNHHKKNLNISKSRKSRKYEIIIMEKCGVPRLEKKKKKKKLKHILE